MTMDGVAIAEKTGLVEHTELSDERADGLVVTAATLRGASDSLAALAKKAVSAMISEQTSLLASAPIWK